MHPSLWRVDLKILADLVGQAVVDLAMSRHCRGLACPSVHVDRVSSAFSQQSAVVFCGMSDEVNELHQATTTGSRITVLP